MYVRLESIGHSDYKVCDPDVLLRNLTQMLQLTWVRLKRLKSCMNIRGQQIYAKKSYQKVRWAEIVEKTKNLGSPNPIHKKGMQRRPRSRY